ncbi:MAG TPA: NAD(P)H-hydrate dehydratase [Gemmataceae bacterium]|nr:NAD(P)H-hydrate dehydratase [Gemmataceae bacterium]
MSTTSLLVVTDVPRLAPRPLDSNKGSYGRVLVVAGSRGMSGAAVLCASAALRGGAGLVRLAVPEDILPIVAAANPCYTTAPLPQDAHGRLSSAALNELIDLVHRNSVAAIGPGLGQSNDLGDMLATLLDQTTTPLVLDADALNVLVGKLDALRKHQGPIVLTPHPGEFARLLGCDIPKVQAHRQELAAEFARTHGVVVVLKGYGTVVTDGHRVYVNTTGNPGMASGGTGDVLGGLIAALIGQKLEIFAAAQLGVYLHGRAGDLAREQTGEVSLIASDLLDILPRAFQGHAARR